MADTAKDTIYIDVDEDITGIIDKVRGSSEKIVALVLPKRATVLQSIVNMKLLKRTSDDEHKQVVLITSENNLLPMAGAVGLYVAKTLQSKPHVPEPPATPDGMEEIVHEPEESEEKEDKPVDKTKSLAVLSGLGLAAAADGEETIEVDNDVDDPPAGGKSKSKKNKKLKVPNFESFRMKLFLIGGAILALIIIWVLATKILPKSKLTITTDSSALSTSVSFTADTAAKNVDEANQILPATQKTFTKTDSEKVDASGQKDKGTKAAGQVSMKLTDCTKSQVTVPAGTIVSANSLNFVTQGDANMSSVVIGNQCKNSDYPTFSTATVNVVAQSAGDKYNLAATGYTVNGFSNVSGSGSAMSGGTSNVVKVVAQSDVDGAKQKMLDRNNDPARAELNKQMQADKLYPINDTFSVGTPAVTTAPNVGDEASSVTVNMTVSYTMLGVKQDDLKKIVENEIKKHIDASKQSILNNGIGNATTTIAEKKSDTVVKVALQTNAEAGAQLDANAIKKAVAGKKRGDTQNIIQARPGIKDVKIDYSPFWVGATPSRTSRITVIFKQPNGNTSTQ